VAGQYYYLFPSQATGSQLIQTVDGINYANKIAQKISQNISGQSSDGVQNGFRAVNTATETMAASGGKKHKTRKFKLTNKKKTRHNK
jgi:hypothetical protein